MDLPFGKGKPIGRERQGSTQPGNRRLAAQRPGPLEHQLVTLPTDMYPTGAPVQYYGHKYPIQDCRSGACLPGYLLWNGYIPAHQINKPDGVMGVPANYKPAASPLWPYPADYNSRSGSYRPEL